MKLIFLALIFFKSFTVFSQNLEFRKNSVYTESEKLSIKETKALFKNNTEILKLYEDGINQKALANVMGFAGGFGIGYAGISMFYGKTDRFGYRNIKPDIAIGITSVGLLVSAFIIESKGKKKIKKAVESYNGLSQNQRLSYNIIANNNGLGLQLNF